MLINTKGELVSAIIPVYNGEKYISAAVKSILQQTHKNFELIVINDGSTDRTSDKLKEFKTHRRVKIVERENKGLVTTLNEGVSYSEGKYIMRMDADDISLPKRMEVQLNFLKSNDLDIVGSSLKTFGRLYSYTRKYYIEDSKAKFQLLFNSCFAHPTVFCKRDILIQYKYEQAYEKIEDFELWTRLATNGCRMGNCPEVHLLYRVHNMQATSVSRAYIDIKRVQIAKSYWEHYFSCSSYTAITELLLSRSYKSFNREHIQALNEFYAFLMRNYNSYEGIFSYQYFLCLLHNFFENRDKIDYLNDLSMFKRSFLSVSNRNYYLKRLPAQFYAKFL